MEETQVVTHDDAITVIDDAPTQVVDAQEAAPAVETTDPTLQKQIAELRKEAAKWRTKVREFEKQQAEQVAELERTKPLEEKLTTYEQKLAQLQQERDALEARTVANEVRQDLLEAGVSKELVDDAFALYIRAVENADEGEEPEIAEFLKSKPYLIAKQQTAQPLTGANPAGKAIASPLTRNEIGKMTSEQYAKERAKIFSALSRGGIR